ncbi:MAG TPA: hypothetical protein DCQ06_06765 [Myxococcales bacterium]|nr:hypothetical protein [Myxococcales bacterium]HAN31285.1 hypothetical protein [Myxococcales bacterium]
MTIVRTDTRTGWRGFVDRVIVAPWGRIDEAYAGTTCGRVSARSGAIITVVTTCLMLVFLRFVVMDRAVQGGIASTLCELGGIFGPSVKETLYGYHRLLINCSWVLGCFFCYFVVPTLVVRQVFGMTLSEFYLKPRDFFRHLPVYGLLFLPVGLLIVVFSASPDFAGQYPFYKFQQSWTDLLIWELAYALQFFALEFFFRGFMLRGLASEMGSMAVLTMAIPYCMIHYGKPLPECLGSIIAGLTLGVLAMDTRSIWGGVTIHVAVAWGMDFAALWRKGILAELQ